jgi:hypothetical protein
MRRRFAFRARSGPARAAPGVRDPITGQFATDARAGSRLANGERKQYNHCPYLMDVEFRWKLCRPVIRIQQQ